MKKLLLIVIICFGIEFAGVAVEVTERQLNETQRNGCVEQPIIQPNSAHPKDPVRPPHSI
ncbi:MAG: hypothetical protein FWE90_06710 [Defluviitaleaceae bacterium]|nr:hypothetical protein [Defluviitaleaceae bacterium]